MSEYNVRLLNSGDYESGEAVKDFPKDVEGTLYDENLISVKVKELKRVGFIFEGENRELSDDYTLVFWKNTEAEFITEGEK